MTPRSLSLTLLLLTAAPPVMPRCARAQTVAVAQTPGVEAARRLVATLQLAAQEYRLAWQNGALTQPEEWTEARLFVTEARHAAADLPPGLRAELAPRLASL